MGEIFACEGNWIGQADRATLQNSKWIVDGKKKKEEEEGNT